jgi:uncharacterized protein (DUF58 family)
VTRTATPKLAAYAGLAALGLLAALAAGRPELVAVAAPFALIVTTGLLLARPPDIAVELRLPADRVLQGDVVTAELELHSETTVPEVEVSLPLPIGLAFAEPRLPVSLRLEGRQTRTIEVPLEAERWGAYLVGELRLRARSRFGLFVYERHADLRRPLKVYPRAEALRELVRPYETQVFSGNQVARTKGDGIEFADLRPFVAGDRLRRINWRASARRQNLWVNDLHPERNADVIVFLDSFEDVRHGDASSLDISVQAAASLIAGYARERDRVGFISFGGVLRWLQPNMGLAQLYRVVEALLDTQITLNYAWKGIDVLPARTLPPQALVIAVTPLLDERAVAALLDLRGRGFDLAVIEVSPVPFAVPGEGEVEELAYRLWRMRREALRARYERAGVATVEWSEGRPLASVLEEVTAFRRHARSGRG